MSDRHEETCYFCPESNSAAIEEHHLVPQRFNGSDEPENTVKLCGSCHDKIEELYDDGFYERLGVAVDGIENARAEHSTGEKVDPADSIDRQIPPHSAHVRFELVPTDGFARRYRRKTARTTSDSGSSGPIQKKASNLTETEHGSPTMGMMEVDYPEGYRMHCGYCHKVYSQHEHSDMARHLRVRHGIENPYEVQDTTFQNTGKGSSSFLERIRDNDD